MSEQDDDQMLYMADFQIAGNNAGLPDYRRTWRHALAGFLRRLANWIAP